MVSSTLEAVGIIVIVVALGLISRFGRRRGISEARFDSKTGKQIK